MIFVVSCSPVKFCLVDNIKVACLGVPVRYIWGPVREDFMREKEAPLKDAELNQLRSVEVERRKWEEREARLVVQEQLDKIKGTTVGSDPCRGCIELESSRLMIMSIRHY